ncbi:DEAD/DEAH box helicase [Aeromonas veronii]|uniref:DEAD/DEAH box helicase n=1 Tax=Aeromonas veronii TaxID=654 RepID=UPI001F3FA300|nr:DEAD/DEAH box helicase [Aeromonas veronii]MCF7742252.1 hypothetical protein [Aeromonas veronii]
MQVLHINDGEYLSSVSNRLPTSNGIHLIQAKTGVGKTRHMTTSADLNHGAVIFPVKAILKQEQSEAEDKKLFNLTFIQIENLSKTDLTKYGELHIDECQILYAGGFRESVEQLMNAINLASQIMPVYLYSATVRTNLLPVVPDTITRIEKPFDRVLTCVELPTIGAITNCTRAVYGALRGILLEQPKPLIAFVNDENKMNAVAEKLRAAHISVVVMSATTIANRKHEAYAAYERIISTSTLGSAGYQVVLATNCLAEGINLNDDIHVVSCQGEDGIIFQQHGRIRNKGSHWLLHGRGTDRLDLKGDKLVTSSGADSWVTPISSGRLEDRCKWADEQAAMKADLFGTFAYEMTRGRYGMFAAGAMEHHGYTPDYIELGDIDPIKTRNAISRKTLIECIREKGIPQRMTEDEHPLVVHLLESYDPPQYEHLLAPMVEWHREWEVMSLAGIRGDCWDVFRAINSLGRTWLIKTIRDAQLRDAVCQSVATFRTQISTTRVNQGQIEELADVFWRTEMPPAVEWKWHAASNKAMRETLFKLLLGFTKDEHGNWSVVKERAAWDVPLTNAERNRFNVRAKHIEEVMAVGEFCERTGHNRKTIADEKTNIIKHQALSFLNI